MLDADGDGEAARAHGRPAHPAAAVRVLRHGVDRGRDRRGVRALRRRGDRALPGLVPARDPERRAPARGLCFSDHAYSRVLLRLLEPLDLPRVPPHRGSRRARRRRADLEADPGRRRLQRGQPERLREPLQPGAGQGRLRQEGPAELGPLLRPAHRLAAGLPGQQREGDARGVRGAGARQDLALLARGVRGLLGRSAGHLAGRRAASASSSASASTGPRSRRRSRPTSTRRSCATTSTS